MIKKLFSSQLRLNIASGVIATVINTVVMAVGYPIYLYYLGYEKYGLWLVLSVVLTFAQLGNLGIGSAVTKLVAEEYSRGNVEAIQRYITTALVLLCLSGSVVLITILLFKGKIVAIFKLSDANAQAVSSLVPYIGILSIYVFVVQVFDAALSGLGRMDLANYIQAAARVAGIIAAALLLYKGLGIVGLLIGNTLSYLVNHLLSFVCIRRIERLRLLQVTNFENPARVLAGLTVNPAITWRGSLKRLLHFGSGVFGGSLIGMLFSPFNKLMLSRYAGVATVPVYEIALAASMQIRGLFEAGLRATMPEISRANANISRQGLNRIKAINGKSMKLVMTAGLFIYAIIALCASGLLRTWLGERYTAGVSIAFQIILLGTYFNLLGVPAFYTLMGTGRVRHILAGNIVQSFTNVILIITAICLTGKMTVYIVCVATLSGMLASTIYLLVQQNIMVGKYCVANQGD